MSTPIAACFFTTSATAWRSAGSNCSCGSGSRIWSRIIASTIAGGLTRLPTCVVRMRLSLRFIGPSPCHRVTQCRRPRFCREFRSLAACHTSDKVSQLDSACGRVGEVAGGMDHSPDYWRGLAEEARTMADALTTEVNRQQMLNIAKSYDMLAEQAEREWQRERR